MMSSGCICGATNKDNHRKDCQYLAAMRAQAYPKILDDNGLPWEQNKISELQEENKALKERITQLGKMYKQKAKHVDNLLKQKRTKG